MSIVIRQAGLQDLQEIAELEKLCFTKEEAASKEVFEYRLHEFPECFYLAEANGRLAGFINGCVSDKEYICDELYEVEGGHNPKGKNQMVFGLVTHPDYRRRGIAEQLLEYFSNEAKLVGREAIVLTCQERLIPYYKNRGFKKIGISQSIHGGIVWYDMVKKI